ncbi:hypothetical protein EYC84_011534 [Monilinia fructicola]|uniref:Uncharacterized protein n=1 Tax=Monilinia fructicola TaxID=38448 RepID=A0A5M9J8K9_MONFR|nr:hypothetical protein EYC84_011534 [Monilinia fructicola]
MDTASVSVDTDPSGSGTCSGWGWGSEGTGYGSVTSSDEDGTSPVGGVGDIGLVGLLGGWTLNVLNWVTVTSSALGSTCLSQGSTWGSSGRAGEDNSSNGGELHFD